MPYVKKRERYTLYIVSCAAGILIGLVGYLVSAVNLRLADYIIVMAIMITLFPIATLEYFEFRWKKAIEVRMPDILYDIAEGQLTGMSFIRALQTTATRDYGVASRELRRVLAQVRLGMSLEEAFQAFAKRVDSDIVKKVSVVIYETNRFGGDVSRIIRSLADYIKSIILLNEERRTTMRMYIGVTYIAFGVLLFTIMILLNQFFMPIIQLSGTIIFTAQASYEEYRRVFFYMTIIQAITSGLVAGKMGEGTMSAGLKHIVIMLFLTLLMFTIVII
ncbi:MAG: type II secretion system F family protein [Candidatus Methanomethyliaceae archaeon]|nr:type II secretion system F family protein [Candidatus Methanomethyliaceae archaeon]